MKNKKLVYAISICLFSVLAPVIAVSASDGIWPPSHYIGTLQQCLDQLQRLPGIIDEAICVNDDAVYTEKMAFLENRIEYIPMLLEEMDLKSPSNLNLKIIYSTITKNKICGVGKIATGYADLAREKLDVVIRDAGLYTEK
ncbi:MAG: hypothetical protein AB9907_12130 [Flexilinea sp.]